MSMETHKDNSEFAKDVKYHVLTTILLLLIRRTSYVVQDEISLGQIIHHLLRVQSYNTHPIMAAQFDGKRGKNNQVGLVRIGNALNFASGSMMNHSCNPNTIRINCSKYGRSGGVMTLFVASRNIGSKVKTNYVKCSWPICSSLPCIKSAQKIRVSKSKVK